MSIDQGFSLTKTLTFIPSKVIYLILV